MAAPAMKEPPDRVTSDEAPQGMSDDGQTLEMRLPRHKRTDLKLAPAKSAVGAGGDPSQVARYGDGITSSARRCPATSIPSKVAK